MGNNPLGLGEGCQGVGRAELSYRDRPATGNGSKTRPVREDRQEPAREGVPGLRRYPPDATVSNRRAFSCVSAHSRSGSEPQVIPAPVPKRSDGPPTAVRSIQRADTDGELSRGAVGVDPADPTAVRAARRGLQRCDDAQRTGLGGARDGAGREGSREQLRPSGVDTRCTRPGCSSTAHRSGTVTEPLAHTRPRSLRTRSTIMTFSAWSFSKRSAAVRPVPLMGPDSTVRPSRRRKSSGEAVAISTPCAGRRTVPV